MKRIGINNFERERGKEEEFLFSKEEAKSLMKKVKECNSLYIFFFFFFFSNVEPPKRRRFGGNLCTLI
jgi:hypothetical protein